MLTIAITLLTASANAYLCCSDVWDDRARQNCQARNTPANGDDRVTTARSWTRMDDSYNAWAKVTAANPGFPAGYVCCLKACCHKTTYGSRSVGHPHITIDCPNNAGVPYAFQGTKHYNCNDGAIQPFTRRLDDEANEMTIVSNAPAWVELKAPEPRRLSEGQDDERRRVGGPIATADMIHSSYYFNAMFDAEKQRRGWMRRADRSDATEQKIAYIGCFTDDSSRDLPQYEGDGMDAVSCSNACNDYVYFALQFDGQCFCGDRYGTSTDYHVTSDAECGIELKGGEWRNAIFIHNLFDNGFTVYDHNSFGTASLSSTYPSADDGYDANRCLDGDLSTYCRSGYDDRAWLRFDLDTDVTVVKVMVANRADAHQDRLGRFQVLLKTANGWTECRRGVTTDTSKQWQEVWCWRPTKAHQVQIQFEEDHEMSYLHIADVKILGKEPEPQYVGCFSDDHERALKHYQGKVDSIQDCRTQCDSFYYFAMQDREHCFCDDGYANDGRYPRIDDSACGEDRRGRVLTNAIFATHGGIPVRESTEGDRRRWGFSGHIWKPRSWTSIMESYLEDIMDDMLTYGECAWKQFEHWRQQHPYEAIFVEVVAAVALVAFLPEIAVGAGAVEATVEVVEIVEELIEIVPEVPKEVPGGSVVNSIVSGIGGLFGRRRLSKHDLKGDLDELMELRGKLATLIQGEEAHSKLVSGFEELLKTSPTRHELLRKEFIAFDEMVASIGLELDDDLMDIVKVYFETFDDLLEADVGKATKCLESGCTLAKIDMLLESRGAAASTGEGEGVGSAIPKSEPEAAPGTDSDADAEPLGRTESGENWPEIDVSTPKSLYTSDEDGWVHLDDSADEDDTASG